MTDPVIKCPKCGADIKLTESLAAPLVESTRVEFERRLAEKEHDMAARESLVQGKARELAEAKLNQEAQVAAQVEVQLEKDRKAIRLDEARKAKLLSSTELSDKDRQLAELQEVIRSREEKLAEAQNAQADLIKKQRALDDEKRELELTIEKRVQISLGETRQAARKEAEDEQKLKVLEKEQTIAAMQRQIEDLKRRAEQGSQQLQGEVQEIELENMLRERFVFDSIEPVAKGEFGGDVLHRVNSPSGQPCGAILWEVKRTKNWSDTWLAKLREDQRTAKAEISVILSQSLPRGLENFDLVEGVWVAHPRLAAPLALVLRQTLLDLSLARNVAEGQQTKTEMIYEYLTGPRFRHRVEAIVEAFSTMQVDLDKERKAITKQWAKRAEQIERVMGATVGMYGDLQGIAGKSLQEIDGLELSEVENQDLLEG